MNAVIIVDAFSSGKNLAYAFKSYGYSLIHVQSSLELSEIFINNFENIKNFFIENIVFESLATLIEKLQKYNIKCVVPGTESGVMLADLINDALKINTANDINYSVARRDKSKMHDVLKLENINFIPHCKTNDLTELLTWVKNNSANFPAFPIVLKPVKSAGTDNVFFCYSEDEIMHAYKIIMQSDNLFGEKNIEVLAQLYLKGEEYIVNTVSHNGTHMITDVWHIRKNEVNRIPIYDYEELVFADEHPYHIIITYAKSVLDALRIKYGAAHTELILTENGPVLLETGARLMGTCDFSVVAEIMGYNQVSTLVESYINPEQFLKHAHENKVINKKYVRNVFLISNMSGVLKKSFHIREFETSPSFYSYAFIFQRSDILPKTQSLVSSPGYIYLLADSKEQLNVEYKKIRSKEGTLYYELLDLPGSK